MVTAILGMGKTGRSLAQYLSQQGEEVWGIDDRPAMESFPGSSPENPGKLFLGGQLPSFEKIHRFFISPGVDPSHPAAREALSRGLRLEGELDLAFSLCRGEVAAITGTNGKSTTTALLGAMLLEAGIQVGIGGNLGTPFLDLVRDEKNFSHFVVEVSSFQLETCHAFRPKVAVLLNLSDDHLDRHRNLKEYLQTKRRIFAAQGPEDFAVYNADDLHVLEAVEGIAAKLVPFSNCQKVPGVYGDETKLHWAPQGTILSTFELSQCSLKGLHNLENISAAIAAAKIFKLSDPAIQSTLNHFQGLPHRIQWVADLAGVAYYDDSKATNVGAVVMSLASFDEGVILIMGGKDKGGDYTPLRPLLKNKARALVVLGEAQEKISKTLQGATEIYPVKDMAAAVAKAHQLAAPGGTVLLSPACSSFDMYGDYHERGEDFKRCVRALAKDGTATH